MGRKFIEELLMPWASTQADSYSMAEVLKQDEAECGIYLPHSSQRKGEGFTEQDCSQPVSDSWAVEGGRNSLEGIIDSILRM